MPCAIVNRPFSAVALAEADRQPHESSTVFVACEVQVEKAFNHVPGDFDDCFFNNGLLMDILIGGGMGVCSKLG